MVRTSAYRQPPTPEGLKKIETGTLKWFDLEMFSNFNTGILEEYMDELNKKESFKRSHFEWKKVLIGILIGSIFALINQYVGLKVGMIVSGAWYLTYLLGLALNWGPTETNIASGASTGASATCTGFVFTFPAIYLLAYHEDYLGENNSHLIDSSMIPVLWIPLIASILAAFLGVMYFIIFRRIWLVEDPLPMPGFQAQVKLMDIANDLTTGAITHAKRSIRIVTMWAGIIMTFTFLRDFPFIKGPNDSIYSRLRGEDISVFDRLFSHNRYYLHGNVMQPYDTDSYTHIGFNLTPIQLAIGWFMKFRVALLVSVGSLFTWFVIVPMAVHFNVPIFDPAQSVYHSVNEYNFPTQGYTPPIAAYGKIARIIAIGAILGGGITALIKMAPVFKTATADIVALTGKGGKESRKDLIKGKGWYEWPITHIPIMMILTFIGVSIIFSLGGFPVPQSFVFSLVLVITTFFLGAIAVKVAGEVGTTPVSGTTFIVLLMLILIFKAMGTNGTTTVIMALVGSTVFGSAITLSSDIMRDFRVGLYTGTRPYHLIKGELSGILPGAIIAVIGASILSYGLAKQEIILDAPQAHAFATFTQILIGGENMNQVMQFLAIGLAIGVFAEIITGMGTAFGLGMYLPLPITLPILFGGAARDLWEKKYLEPTAEREEWDEKQKTFKTLETYMVATGFIVGEALMGTIVALYLVIPLLT